MSYRTGNPALNEEIFTENRDGTVMTLEGTATKTLILLVLVIVAAAFTWTSTAHLLNYNDVAIVQQQGQINSLTHVPGQVWGFVLGGCLIGFVVALVIIFNPPLSPYLAPIYALLEGVCLGAWSQVFEYMYPGIVVQALGITFGTLFTLLLAYRLRLVQATENFKLAVIAATGGICIVYLFDLCLGLFAGVHVPFVHETGVGGIIFSLFVVVIAAANLVLDFDFIETGVNNKAAKYMEWYSAFGLLVTLVWLYLEIVRLLAKLRSKD